MSSIPTTASKPLARYVVDGQVRTADNAVRALREKLQAIPNIDPEAALEEIFTRHQTSPLGLEQVYEEWRHAHKLATFGERYGTAPSIPNGPWVETWREQLEETARLVAHLMTTCAFCGHESDFHNPVRQCVVCRVPTCRLCLLSISSSPDGIVCRHAPRRRP